MSYQITTKNGYDFFECTSSFQKAIRRGDEDTALFFAVELYISNYAEYVWKRVFVMVSEDIGLANPALPQQIWSLYEMYALLKKKADKHEPEKLHFIHAILLLVRSPKSRMVDWALIHAFRKHDTPLILIPDYALDKHTRRGKALNRGFDHFFAEGCKLENHKIQPREQEYMDSSRDILIGIKPETDLFGKEVEEEEIPPTK